MKIYSNTIDLATPANRTFYVAPFSDFKLATKIVVNGVEDETITYDLFKGTQQLAPDGQVDGFATYTQKSLADGEVMFKIVCSNGQTAYIKEVVTDSTVFEVGGEGGSMPEGNFVRAVNGELPVNGNVDVKALKYEVEGEEASITGATIAESLNNIDEQLETKADIDDVNDKINQFAAHYLTKMNGNQFATHAELAAAKQALIDDPDTPQFKYGDDAHIPDKNDYLIVVADELHNGKTTRYAYVGDWPTGFFRYQYTINDTTFTPSQLNVLNSGVNADNTVTLSGEYDDGTEFNFTVYVKNV